MEAGRPLVLPVAQDAFAARLIGRAGFKAFAIGGSAMLAARYGLPDLGIAALGEMVAGIQDIAAASDLPFITDGDDGYGDIKSVVRMIRAYEALGVGAVILEDQARPSKQPGDNPAPAVVAMAEFETKLRAAVDARSSGDMLIIARTDSLTTLGLDGALKRAERSLAAGADGVFIPGLKAHDDLVTVGSAFRGKHQLLALTEDGKAQLPRAQDLFVMGYDLIAYPSYLMLRTTEAMASALAGLLLSTADGSPLPALADFPAARAAFAEAVGLRDWQALDKVARSQASAPAT
ncbi:2,3-dimethylmalate lyase (plasmid) [Bradyrhizobium sp. CCBAU 53351]|nr:2,3-dimethylmalate lyase [Bradyrhizobium guangdongense]QAU50871.1 2,3-dimethylmalate lyase [Bradyrhizobium guangzhouense]QOZ49540.1 2,3-dimethylmalate lyase [Bradyrhizobium sp. CCBAU 53340]QOZ56657.1 2,3-dimethylmalate lyase [Bradyrhizobium sp. CCBAU 53338]QOZ81299.1 2,3-dimethylmalate lyase [Bradyrhizobium sp. CCBAU 53351]